MRVDRELRKKRITAIAQEIIAGMVAKGDLDPDDAAALEGASRQAVLDAAAVYDAAMEYLS